MTRSAVWNNSSPADSGKSTVKCRQDALTADKEKADYGSANDRYCQAGPGKESRRCFYLNASNISVTPMRERKDGKDKETTTARKVNKTGDRI